MFIDVMVLNQKTQETEEYLINTANISYMRRWVGEKGMLQTVVHFVASDKRIIVNMERDTLARLIMEKQIQLPT
jgi:hypothetical protein